jgi:beta-glucosidase-like glycosyl hydrolase
VDNGQISRARIDQSFKRIMEVKALLEENDKVASLKKEIAIRDARLGLLQAENAKLAADKNKPAETPKKKRKKRSKKD